MLWGKLVIFTIKCFTKHLGNGSFSLDNQFWGPTGEDTMQTQGYIKST